MSRDFGTNGTITFGAGGAASTNRNITQVAIVKFANDSAGIMQGRNNTTQRWSFLFSGSTLFSMDDFGDGSGTTLSTDTWYIVAVSKGSGTVAPRYHWKPVGSGSWSHDSSSGTVSNGTANITNIRLGVAEEVGDVKLAAVAVFDGALSDGAIEALGDTSMAAWLGASPLWAVQLNQASTGDTVPDLTGGGGDQTAISGTSVDADEPSGWTYYDGSGETGELAATLPAITAALTAEANVEGTLAGSLPAITGAFTGEVTADGQLAGTLPAITASLAGDAAADAAMSATLPAITAALTGAAGVTGELGGSLPAITANLTAEANVEAALAATLPAITAALTGDADVVTAQLAGTLPAITATLAAEAAATAALSAVLPAITAALQGAHDSGATLHLRIGGQLVETGITGAFRLAGSSVAFG